MRNLRICLSGRYHLPCLKFGTIGFGWKQWRALSFSRRFSDVTIHKVMKETVTFTIGEDMMILPQEYFSKLFCEWDDWESNYFPVDLTGKTVLDIGAGAGETALWFLTKGAGRIICVEIDQAAFDFLRLNSEINDWNCRVFNEPFKLDHLTNWERSPDWDYDFFKIDVEGAEEILLERKIPLKGQGVIEYHKKEIAEGLRDLYGMRIVRCREDWLGYAFFNC